MAWKSSGSKLTESHPDWDYLRPGGTTPLPGAAPRPAA